MNDDETGKLTIAYMIFHSILFVTAGFTVILSLLIFIAIISFQSQIALTYGTFFAVFVGFIGSYWAYFEFEYIYRTYLFYWRNAMEHASERYTARNEENNT
jgi:uncharacterized membrane-anchored protein